MRRPATCPTCGQARAMALPKNRGAQLLRAVLRARGCSALELAQMTGLAAFNLIEWMRRGRPNLSNALLLKKRLEIPVEAWLEAPHGGTVNKSGGEHE